MPLWLRPRWRTRVLSGGFSIPAQQALPRVRVPVVLIQGDQDALVKMEMATAGQKLMPRAQISVYAQTGHATFFERARTLQRRVERVRSRRRADDKGELSRFPMESRAP